MKRKTFILLSVSIFCFLSSFSQQQSIKLNLEEGFEYVYELSWKEYVQKKNGEKGKTRIFEKVLKIMVENFDSTTSIMLRVNFEKNFEENFSNFWKERTDFIYPDFKDYGNNIGTRPEIFFSRSELIFNINLDQRIVELQNGSELLEMFKNELIESKLSDEEKRIKSFENIYLTRQTKLVEHLLWFHNVEITSTGRIRNSILDDKLIIKEKYGSFFNLENNDKELNIKPGKEYKNFSVNIGNGLLEKYHCIRKDSIQNKYGENVGEYLFNVTETDYRLLSKKKTKHAPVIISGKIENPLSNKLFFRYLNEPFGLKLKKETIYLNDDGSFHAELELKHEGFIYIENQNPNRFKPSVSYTLFAAQGDSIYFHHDLNNLNKHVYFRGNRIGENQIIQQIKEEFNILNSGEFLDNFNDARINYDPIVTNASASDIINKLEAIYQEFESVENILSENKDSFNSLSYQFIENEIKNYYYDILFHFLTMAIVIERNQETPIQIPETIYNMLNMIDLHETYNDFGFFSRKCIRNFIRYKYFEKNEIKNVGSAFGRSYTSDLGQQIQFARMVIMGSPLYREIAALMGESFSELIHSPWKDYSSHITDLVINNLNLIIENCGDKEIFEKVERILHQYEQMQRKNQEITELVVFNERFEKVRLKEILVQKPTVLLFASGIIWSTPSFEKYQEENPEIGFVRILQSSNKKEWEEYFKLAKPEIPTFLYLNDSISLENIFLNTRLFAIFDSAGELIDFTTDVPIAVKAAQESLLQKERLNKSQLQIIVLLLSIVIILLIAGFIIWKWRVRKRLRTEEQQRRLRELELTAIRSQMNPHFLFNCLNSVQNLVQQNKGREAHLYLADFAGLIRKVLQNSEKEEVSLAEDLETVEQYLRLEKLRFDFDFQITVSEGIDPHNTPVPSMLLQPFAENAVIHGLQHKEGERMLKIEVLKESKQSEHTRLAVDNRLVHKASKDGVLIIIEDNGIGRAAAQNLGTNKNGKGSKLMQERLKILQEKQGEKYRLQITDLTENGVTGTRVEIWVPEEK